MKSYFFSFTKFEFIPAELFLNLVSEGQATLMNAFVQLASQVSELVMESLIFVRLNLGEHFFFLLQLTVEIIQALKSVIAMGPEKSAVRANLLFVRDADDVHDYFVRGTYLLRVWGSLGAEN